MSSAELLATTSQALLLEKRKTGSDHEIEASTERFLAIRAQSGDGAWTGGIPAL